MKEKILTFLKTKLSGVPENYLLGVAEHYSKTVTEESQIATTLTDGVVDLLKLNAGLLQSEGDKRATEAAKTALKTFREKHGLDENGNPIKREDKKEDVKIDLADPASIQKIITDAITAAVTPLQQKIEAQEKEKTSTALSERVMKHEKLKDIPASFLKGRNLTPSSEAEIDQLVASIEADYNGFKQEMTEKGVVIAAPPVGGGGQVDKSTIDTYLDEKFPKVQK